MEIKYDVGRTHGVYFYKTQKKDIEFEKVNSTTGTVLKKLIPNAGIDLRNAETFELDQKPDGSFSGTWTNNKNKKLPVVLHPLDPKTMKHPYSNYAGVKELLKREPIEYIRAASVQVKIDSVVKKGTLTLQYVHADNSAVYMPTIMAGVPKDMAIRLNEILLGHLVTNASRSYSCGIGYHLKSIYLYHSTLSLHFTEYWDCPGANYPDDAEYGITLNTGTGKELTLEDLLHVPGLPATPPANSNEWMFWRIDKFGPKLVVLLTRLYPDQMKDDDEACSYSANDPWAFSDWYLSPKGLHLLPMFPRIATPCRAPSWSVIPYKVLKQYLDPAAKIDLPPQ
jgi:hypothetical protein